MKFEKHFYIMNLCSCDLLLNKGLNIGTEEDSHWEFICSCWEASTFMHVLSTSELDIAYNALHAALNACLLRVTLIVGNASP